LQRITEQQESSSALTSAGVLWCCITAHLGGEQTCIGVIAVAQACCWPVLQSSTEQQESSLALTSAGVLWCCIIAHLCGEQTCLDVIAVTRSML